MQPRWQTSRLLRPMTQQLTQQLIQRSTQESWLMSRQRQPMCRSQIQLRPQIQSSFHLQQAVALVMRTTAEMTTAKVKTTVARTTNR
jgi:hypothetical protein